MDVSANSSFNDGTKLLQPQQNQQQHSGELEFLGDNAARVTARVRSFKQKYAPALAKQASKLDAMVNELVVEPMVSSVESSTSSTAIPMETDEERQTTLIEEESPSEEKIDLNYPPEPELSVHAQFLLIESLNSLKKVLGDMTQEHKHPIHHLISRCGKAIDTRFFSDLGRLLKNEKEIERNPENLRNANRLILEHLLGLGRTETAEAFMQESEMLLDPPNIDNFETMKQIMGSFKERDYLPAIQWIKANAKERHDLLFRLQCQHVIRLLETSGKKQALHYVRDMKEDEKEKYQEELKQLMFVVMTYPQKGLHDYLFHEGRWFALEQELSHALTDYRSSMTTILNAGIKTVPSLMTLRAFLNTSRGGLATLPDELPCNVIIPEQVHSSFCCPILKVQSTEANPPVRLSCGHVISTDAMNRLAQQSRNSRLKCPYCPLESVLQECKVLYF